MSDKIRNEKINLNNIDIFFLVQKTIWPDEPDYDCFVRKATADSDFDTAWLVYNNDVLIGITGVYMEDVDEESIWLDWYGVLPEYRRCGLGKKILLDTIDYCKKLNRYKYFRLDTTYYDKRPALFLYDEVMDLKEEYTVEDTDCCKNNFLSILMD